MPAAGTVRHDAIPVNQVILGERELALATECIRNGWISSEGSFVREFEARWAEYCGMEFGIAMCNGTVALEAAVECLDLSAGDEVIIPAFTIVSCAQAVVYSGAKPVLVDADPRTWCLDVDQLAERVSPRTKAIMPVHIYGHPVNMAPVLDLAASFGLKVIEDAAEAHGAEYEGRRCGGLGDLSCFSFYANKIITTGEGGMVLTGSARLAERLRSLRNLCFQREQRFLHEKLGHNFRLTNIQAALGVAQVEKIDQAVMKKRWMAERYLERLGTIEGLVLPTEQPWAKNVYWMFGVVLSKDLGWSAGGLRSALSEQGIESRPFFLGMHRQPALRRLGLFEGESYPVTDWLSDQGLYLPSGLGITEEQIDTVCRAVGKAIKGRG